MVNFAQKDLRSFVQKKHIQKNKCIFCTIFLKKFVKYYFENLVRLSPINKKAPLFEALFVHNVN